MPITIKHESDANSFGTNENSYSVPMANFALIANNHEIVKYLKSTGFASCIGLVLYNSESTLLAHFQSANWAKRGVENTLAAFGNAGILNYGSNEGFVFLGSNVNEPVLEPQQEKSQANTKNGLRLVKEALRSRGARFLQNEPDIGFKSAALCLGDGELRLFEETPKAKLTRNANGFPAVGSALTRAEPG